MRKLVRAILIRRKILNRADDDWGFIYHNGIMRLSTGADGWHAIVWTSLLEPSHPSDTGAEGKLFLEKCRKRLCPHTIDVWCDDRGKVLSLRFTGAALRLITFMRGDWENFFGLRPPGYRKASELKISR